MAAGTRTALETGWRPDTPVDDTALRHGLVAVSAAWESAGRAGGARLHRNDRYSAVDFGRPTGLFNSATLLQPAFGDDLDRTLADIERFYGGGGSGSVLLWSPWPTPDLSDRGWELEGHPPMVFRPARGLVGERIPQGLALRPVTEADDFDDWCTVAVEGFPFDEVRPPESLLDAAVLDDHRWQFFVGGADRPLAVGCQFVDHDMNVLLLAATRSEARGRGLYSALAAHRLAREANLPAVAIVSDDSRPILVDRFGFVPITRFSLWARPRP